MFKKQNNRADILSVAKLANVSAATVSRALNHPELVTPSTRKRIDSAIRKTGYIRNRAAQAMHGRRSSTIGMVVPTINYAIFAELVQAFSDTVSERGFTLLLVSHGYDLETEYAVIRKLLEHRVDGIALIGLEHAPETLNMLARQDTPVISIWNYDANSVLPCIGADNMEAARLAAAHLLLLGHRKIGLVFPPVGGNDRAAARLGAALDTLEEAGIEVPAKWRIEAPYSIARSKDACLAVLQSDDRPTALLCGNDVIAHGAVYAAAKAGIDVPGALSIAGIGDFVGSADMEPPLTTIRIPSKRIGRMAGQTLAAQIMSDDNKVISRAKIDVELMMRGTTAPPGRRP